MRNVDRIDINRKWPMPKWAPVVIIIAIVSGIFISRCAHKAQQDYIVFSNVYVESATKANIDVKFTAYNRSLVDYENKKIIIRALAENGQEIASRITSIPIKSGEKKTFLMVLQKLKLPISDENDIDNISVELYNPGVF